MGRRAIPMLVGVLATCGGGCGGRARATQPPPDRFARLERCVDTLERLDRHGDRVGLVLVGCTPPEDPQAGTRWERLERTASWIAAQRSAARAAERDDLVRALDRAASAVFELELEPVTREYALPLSTAQGEIIGRGASRLEAAGCVYSRVTRIEVRHERCGTAQLHPDRRPPIGRVGPTRTGGASFPLLIVADAGLPAARVLSLIPDDFEHWAAIAVRRKDGPAIRHPVHVVRHARLGMRVMHIELATDATVQELVDRLDRAADRNMEAVAVRQQPR